MDLTLLGHGLVLGFTIAAAVGPITLLCIRRTLGEGRVVGLASGLGVATADATYGAIAAFGLTAVTDLLVDWRRLLGLVGDALLLWLVWKTLRTVPGEGHGGPDAARRPDRRLPARRTNRGCAPRTSRRSFTATNCYSVTSELVVGQSTQAGSMVGAAGFEPAISCSQSTRVARLRHAPTL